MNHTPIESNHARQADLDRLVTGDLSKTERTALIHWLEAEPSRWRLCGLTFLEAQLWHAAFVPIAEQRNCSDTRPISRDDNQPRAGAAGRHRMLLTVIVVLVAFGSGLALGRAPRAASEVTQSIAERPSVAPSDSQVTRIEDSPQKPVVQLPERDNAPVEVAQSEHPRSAVPEYVERQFQRRGYELQQTQRWIPLALNDGRRGVVPVDRVQLKYVGLRSY